MADGPGCGGFAASRFGIAAVASKVIATANKVSAAMRVNDMDFMLIPVWGYDLRSVDVFRRRILIVIPFVTEGPKVITTLARGCP
jgi:hypothetical protein